MPVTPGCRRGLSVVVGDQAGGEGSSLDEFPWGPAAPQATVPQPRLIPAQLVTCIRWFPKFSERHFADELSRLPGPNQRGAKLHCPWGLSLGPSVTCPGPSGGWAGLSTLLGSCGHCGEGTAMCPTSREGSHWVARWLVMWWAFHTLFGRHPRHSGPQVTPGQKIGCRDCCGPFHGWRQSKAAWRWGWVCNLLPGCPLLAPCWEETWGQWCLPSCLGCPACWGYQGRAGWCRWSQMGHGGKPHPPL